jgi:hypothetical protein
MAEPTPAEITSRPPEILISPERAAGPGVAYIGRDDRLYVRSMSLVSTRGAKLAGRLLLPDGSIRPFVFAFTVPAVAGAQAFELAEGYLLSVTMVLTQAASESGIVYAELGILRGRAADLHRVQLLVAGKPDLNFPIGWPGGKHERPVEGTGHLRRIGVADPAPGAEWTLTLGTTNRTLIHSIRFTFVTSAAAANRTPRVDYVVNGITVWRSRAHTAQTASQTQTYNFARNVDLQTGVTGGEFQNHLPEIQLPPGSVVQSTTSGIDAGDDYDGPAVVLEEWLAV